MSSSRFATSSGVKSLVTATTVLASPAASAGRPCNCHLCWQWLHLPPLALVLSAQLQFSQSLLEQETYLLLWKRMRSLRPLGCLRRAELLRRYGPSFQLQDQLFAMAAR